jgi:hypothetical protein
MCDSETLIARALRTRAPSPEGEGFRLQSLRCLYARPPPCPADPFSPLPPSLKAQTPTWAKAAALAKEWGLNRLAERLDALGR